MALEKHILSKSTFMYGCQCTKRLYLHKYRPELRNPVEEEQQSIFESGTNVGELARDLFKGGVDATPPDSFSYQLSVEQTAKLISQGERIIYEAAFQHEGVLCALDILVKRGEAWYAFEVKSSTRVKDQHIQDAALQYFIVRNCGIPIEDISIVHINKQYVKKGELDVEQLFTRQSILNEVIEQQEFIASKIEELKAMLTQPEIPSIDIGPHCYSPYACDFTEHCWSHIPKENSIFELRRGPGWELYEAGYKHLDEIPEDYEMSNKAFSQLVHYRTGEIHIDKDNIKEFLDPLNYPLYFFDFETIMPGVPEFEDSRPYQQIPFQFSLHVQQMKDGELEHYEFLGDGLSDPRPALMKTMLNLLGKTGSIICYNMTFEKSRIKELARIYPEYETELLAVNNRVFDLMIPFQKQWYYHPAFKGSYSIKIVLPTLVPELKYSDLEIQEGGTASLVYSQLKYQNEDTARILREQLLAYCKMDTLAMVKILEYLRTI
ncbi:MAG: hypothetical protein OJF59_000598 [Cytophagales bacterium]|jgi:hypothetical protein|nr:MAG: hypothetical protein OJF59_000598 [Cytophagales bacterium]